MTDKFRERGRLIALAILMIILLLGMLSNCNKEYIVPYNCIDENKIVPYIDRMCTMEVEYVCGCDGLLYINKCHAEADGLTNTWPATLNINCKQ
mgnify:CR=1 FL=1